MNEIEYRQLMIDDLPRLARFIEPFVESGRLLPRTRDELESLIPGGFVATYEGGIVGVAALEVYSAKLAEIRSLAVDPQQRGKGIGRELVARCVGLARERNVLEVMAVTSEESFFQSCGFEFTLPREKKALFISTRGGDAASESS